MAATRLISLHVNKGKTIAQTLFERTDYAMNPDKTKDGELVTGYECDPRTVDAEFLLSKREYAHITGRDQGRKDVLAYHIRQSFKPGETDAETANKIGYELAMSFTKGNHAFIVATHIDKAHIHNHIIFNSTALSCGRKFENFKYSAIAIRRISDLLCLKYGLSVIENPKLSKGNRYADWAEAACKTEAAYKLGKNPLSWREQLRRKIDEVLPSCSTFEEFLTAMKAADYIINNKGKYISLTAPGQKRPTRLKSLGEKYTEDAIRERLGMTITVASSGSGGGLNRSNLLIDIQAKISEGKGAGYEHWAHIFNIKQAAKTLLYLKENGIDSYDDLVKKTSSVTSGFSERTDKIKAAEKRMNEISELQRHIGTYGKTRETYTKYKASGWNKNFYEEHRADITLHRAAKKYFDGLGLKKLPAISSLKQEYGALIAEKKKLYSGYRNEKENMQALLIAKGNVDKLLGIKPEAPDRDIHARNDSHEK